jgi:hypothetical protein
MPRNFFSPKPGRLGVLPNVLVGRCARVIADSATTTYNFGGHPAKCYINRAIVSAGTVPASTGGTILATLQKYDAVANSAVTLTANIDLEALTANEGTAVSLLSTLTEAQQTLLPGDTVRLAVVTTSSVTTAEVDLVVNVELLVEE